MLTQVLAQFFERDLNKLKDELGQYSDEADIWRTEAAITNSAGNLTLHLIGNLNHFLGATLGNSGYIRNRDLEFSDKGISRAELVAKIDPTIEIVNKTLASLRDEDLAKTFPLEIFGKPDTTEFVLTHLSTHLSYHLGQINYHRRLLSRNDKEG